MKKLLSVFIIAASLTAFGCGGGEKHEEKKDAHATEEKHDAGHGEEKADSSAAEHHGDEKKADEAHH